MKKFVTIITASLLMGLAAQAQTQPDPGSPVAGGSEQSGTTQIVIDFNDSAWDYQTERVAAAHHLTMRPNSAEMVNDDNIYLADVPTASVQRIINELEANPLVAAVDRNIEMRAYYVPNDPMYSQQWGLARVGLEESNQIASGRGVVVAVIDTGVACENYNGFTTLTDLAGTHCIPGWNFVNDTAHANDDHGHGTHVAGTIAQTTNNAFGGAGVAYGATIMPVKVLSASGSGSLADVAEGIRWAADHDANVINLSLGGGGRHKVIDDAVKYAHDHGTIVICAAGNDGGSVGNPANSPYAVAISATDSTDTIAYFSNRGREIAFGAPGVGILQQTICERGMHHCEQFATWNGTSMASPHAAGVAALVYGMGVDSPDEVLNIMRAYASRPAHGDTTQQLYGAGIVSASGVTRGLLWKFGTTRMTFLVGLTIALYLTIRSNRGKFLPVGIAPAFQMGVGLFFLPIALGQWSIPFSQPLAMMDLYAFGTTAHRWHLFANLPLMLLFTGLLFSRPSLRPIVGGLSLGVASYYASELWLNNWSGPLGSFLFVGWAIVNIIGCFWIAAQGFDGKTAERAPITEAQSEGPVTIGG